MSWDEVRDTIEKLHGAWKEIEAEPGVPKTALEHADGVYEGEAMARLLAASAQLGGLEERELRALDPDEAKAEIQALRAELMDLLDRCAADYGEAVELEDYAAVELVLDRTDAVAGDEWRKSSRRYREAKQKLARVVRELEAMDLDERLARLYAFFEYREYTVLFEDLDGADEPFVARQLLRLRELVEAMSEHPKWAKQDARELPIHINDQLEKMSCAEGLAS